MEHGVAVKCYKVLESADVFPDVPVTCYNGKSSLHGVFNVQAAFFGR